MTTLIVIPARYASSRFPGKPLAQILGPDGAKTLVQRSFEAGMRAAGLIGARLVVATDDARIQAHVQGFGGQVVMTSPAAQNGTERCAEVAQHWPDCDWPDYDCIVNLQGDAPLTPPWFIADLIGALKAQPQADMATPVLRCTGAMRAALLAERHAGRVGGTTAVFAANGRALYFSKEVIPHGGAPAGDAEMTDVFHHVGLYAYRPASLRAYPSWPMGPLERAEGLEQLRFLEQGRHVHCQIVDAKSQAFWEVNNPGDIAIVQDMLRRKAEGGR
jgi:3-deoxy-manno-octulosonate cytidylyltransferase (CMP-KDO synthetase)